MSSLPPPPTVTEAIARVRARNDAVRAFVCTDLDRAEKRAQEIEQRAARTPITGLPYSLKDLWDTQGITTTGCSYRHRSRIPEQSAPIHSVLEDAGAVFLGKTNASDYGLAMENDSYVGGRTANPHDPLRTAGGSSGGAAAAVADRMVAFDWGSDFGGSIRLPAAFCGVYGMRLSTEAWPVSGHFPQVPTSLRHMNGQGPITARLDVMRDVLRIAAPKMRTGSTRRFELRGAYLYEPKKGAAGMWPSFAEDVRAPLERAAGEVRGDHGLPSVGRAADIARAIYSSHLMEFLESDKSLTFFHGLVATLSSLTVGARFGDRRIHPRTAEILLSMLVGRVTIYRDMKKADADARRLRDDVSAVFDRGYVLVMPTTTYSAPRHGRVLRTLGIAAFNMPGNVADVTGLAVPFGRFPDGMPRSIQIWGPPGSEETLISIAERL